VCSHLTNGCSCFHRAAAAGVAFPLEWCVCVPGVCARTRAGAGAEGGQCASCLRWPLAVAACGGPLPCVAVSSRCWHATAAAGVALLAQASCLLRVHRRHTVPVRATIAATRTPLGLAEHAHTCPLTSKTCTCGRALQGPRSMRVVVMVADWAGATDCGGTLYVCACWVCVCVLGVCVRVGCPGVVTQPGGGSCQAPRVSPLLAWLL
jgi:hypothetical protein